MKERFDGLVEYLLNSGISLDEATQVLEKSMIQGALARNGGNQCAASRSLEIHRNTLQRKMVEYGLATARPRTRRKPMVRAGHPRRGSTGSPLTSGVAEGAPALDGRRLEYYSFRSDQHPNRIR